MLLGCLVARADVKVTVDHNDNDHATAAFTFKDVPAVAKNNAAINAKFTRWSMVPRMTTAPSWTCFTTANCRANRTSRDQNYFLSADGGRIAVDLGSVIDVKQVDSYSWHPRRAGGAGLYAVCLRRNGRRF